jgi:D-amino-acid dehydrogenase
MRIVVVGTGIVGVCTAAWLQRDGHHVTFVSDTAPGQACSFGNAGSLSPSACLPVGMPGMWRQVPAWLRDPEGPLAIRPAYLPLLLPWLIRFLRASRRQEVVRIATALRGLLAPIFESYEPLLARACSSGLAEPSMLMRRTGCLYVYGSRAAAQRWAWGMNLRKSLGVDMRDIGPDELADLEPDLYQEGRGRFSFGILAPENGSTPDPAYLVAALHAQCLKDGAIQRDARVLGFERHGRALRGVRLGTPDGEETLGCDGLVLAAGAWSAPMARALGANVPLETQRGYHVTIRSSQLALRHTVMAPEFNLMINPMAMGLRMAGSVEFGGLQAPPNWARADVLLAKGKQIFPHLDTSTVTRWMGHRPCLPDSLPIIGVAPAADNAWLAFGHGHVGMCGGATTGREVANLVAGRTPRVDLRPFSPARF